MDDTNPKQIWLTGSAYEPYIGRWSRPVAKAFLDWLASPKSLRWLDVGCGTGALTQTIFERAQPAETRGVDPSEGFLALARQQVPHQNVQFELADAVQLSLPSAAYDRVVSGLVLNFIDDPKAGLAEMIRVTRPNGMVAAYVWDYAGRMELIRYFWDAAIALKPEHRHFDEGVRFPICQPDALQALFERTGLGDVDVTAIDVPTRFRDFDDYWSPFLAGQFPAPLYAMSLSEQERAVLRDRIKQTLPIGQDGSIKLIARAWAVRGVRRGHD